MISSYKSTRLERNEQLRQNLQNSSTQNFAAHKKQKDEQIQKKSMEKNIVIPSYNREIENMSSIERLKYEYGIEKNVVLTKDNVELNRELIEKYMEFFSTYVDIFLDLITPAESKFHLYFYQRIFLRACMRFKYHFCIASRGYSKSFLSILAGILRCIFLPGTTMFLVAPGASQGVEIAQEKINLIFNIWPMLAQEVAKKNESQKEINLFFKNGSNFDVLTVTSKSRGLRRNAGIIDEVRDHDPEKLNAIVIPVMNISRRTASGQYNIYEKHQPQTFISSASQKSDYCYQKLIDFLERSILNPNEIYVEGCDYHVPVACGLMPQDFINDVKNDATFNEITFAQEYLSIFTGGASNSWMQTSKLTRLRRIINPQYKAKPSQNGEFYIISVDVARSGEARSIACVWQVLPRKAPQKWIKKLVNLYTFRGDERHFQDQANALKKLIAAFDPKEVVIDGTGLGRGLLDFMVIETFDNKTGEMLPAYGSYNDEELKKVQPSDAPQIINVLIASASLNTELYSIAYSEIMSGHVRLLIEENEAKAKLMSTKIGQKMTLDKRVAKLMPYEMTTRLIEEIGNLRIKANTNSGKNIMIERINKEIQKDRFSSMIYGLYSIRLKEDKEAKKNKRSKNKLSAFIMKN
jgi:hypothetical protein